MLAKRFFYVSAGLFLLALTYHLGARGAVAQGSMNPVVAIGPGSDVLTANGDVYFLENAGTPTALHAVYGGNIFGVPTPATSTSWGKVKADYRK